MLGGILVRRLESCLSRRISAGHLVHFAGGGSIHSPPIRVCFADSPMRAFSNLICGSGYVGAWHSLAAPLPFLFHSRETYECSFFSVGSTVLRTERNRPRRNIMALQSLFFYPARIITRAAHHVAHDIWQGKAIFDISEYSNLRSCVHMC